MIVHDLEQRSPDWYYLRAGKPTASSFGNLITSKGERSKSLPQYALTLAIELYAKGPVNDFEGSAYMERGRELESEALAWYAFERGVDIEPVGFITDDQERFGCSPDGLVPGGMVEVKCLKAENHLKALLRHRKDGVAPPDYVQQTQGQMMIAERSWCDLIFYHPALPPVVIRQTPDPGIYACLADALEEVIAERDRVFSELQAYGEAA